MPEDKDGRLIVLNPINDFSSGVPLVTAPLAEADLECSSALPPAPLPADEAGKLAAAGLRGEIRRRDLPADLFVCAECSSTFDLAWKLRELGFLHDWDAALALRQTAGRGQMRRHWQSLAGNLHVSFRLPERFAREEAAPILTALLFIRAFAALGLPLLFKWPNDLVLAGEAGPGKLGGLLLEERAGVLLAGLGVNARVAPDAAGLRSDAVLPAARLPEDFCRAEPVSLWLDLVYNARLVYKRGFAASSLRELLCEAEKYLLWKGSEVQVLDACKSGSITRGLLCGLTERGGLRLLASPAIAAGSGFDGKPAADWADGLRNRREIALYSGNLQAPSDTDSG